ncbi:hypothetical protein NP233_g12912 [Leucocoprinus birnbaumii]|uniref:Uncharacterized protein n=1 Tax=Leucocoprinus birnbaumii TaxID=56174 RepID=A0AAD5YMM3_9AGAR|nr:hypothetical protein NP233_g12912 [Leucocoprinus birnbaumii]
MARRGAGRVRVPLYYNGSSNLDSSAVGESVPLFLSRFLPCYPIPKSPIRNSTSRSPRKASGPAPADAAEDDVYQYAIRRSRWVYWISALGLIASLREHLRSSARLGATKTAFVELILEFSNLKPFTFLLSNLAAARASSTGWNLYNECPPQQDVYENRTGLTFGISFNQSPYIMHALAAALSGLSVLALEDGLAVSSFSPQYSILIDQVNALLDTHRIDDAAAPADQRRIKLGGNHTVPGEVHHGGPVHVLWYLYSHLKKIFGTPCTSDHLHAHRAELPNTGAFITFICVPVKFIDIWGDFGLNVEFLDKHIPSSCPPIHIFEWPIVQSMWPSDQSLMVSSANRIHTMGFVHESTIILMTFGWDSHDWGQSLEEYEKQSGSIEHCWKLIQRVVGRLDKHFAKSDSADQDVIAQIKRNAEDWRVKWIQQDIDELYVELDKTPAGRFVRRRLKRVSEDQSKYLEPILAQMDDEDLGEEERKTLEEKMEEEYALSRREFQRHFEIIREMEISIGPFLRLFYKLPPPIEPTPKKRFFFF